MSEGVRCMWMRGGTSKGGYFLADDLPADRDAFLMRIMGSPDPRQIDGMGGADPLTSKVAVVARSARPGVDVDYLFLQVSVDQPLVSDGQNCGNILAGVAPFAIERGLVKAQARETRVVIYMENTGQTAIATVQTPDGRPRYDGTAAIDGVPGTAAPIALEFADSAGSSCVVVLRAADLGITGQESRAALDANSDLKATLEKVRLACGPLMRLGDVTDKTVPKMTLVSAPAQGGVIATRTFIPHRCHASIGVLGAVSVATACLLPGAPAAALAVVPEGARKTMAIEHPSGETTVIAQMQADGSVGTTAILRTARKLMDGQVFTGD
jgi:4-oxalomesaconate tautomerase